MKLSKKSLVASVTLITAIVAAIATAVNGLPDFDFTPESAPVTVSAPVAADAGVQ